MTREGFGVSLRIFTRAEFMSERGRRYRAIAKADGALIYGEDLLVSEKMPKAGLMLALLLNEDVIETLDEAKKWMGENPSATPMQISRKSQRLAKRLIDFVYGVVMANKPQFTASRKERVERILEMYPDNKKIMDALVGISRYGVGEMESFKNTIEGFRPRAVQNLKKMMDVKEHIEKTSKDSD